MAEQQFIVIVYVTRPTGWQPYSEAAYGPLTQDQMRTFVGSLQAIGEDTPVQRIVAYVLTPVDGLEVK